VLLSYVYLLYFFLL